MADFPSRLRELQAQKKLRQKDLAVQLGVAQTTIANYEQGSRFPGEKTTERIADFFDVSLDYLLGRAESSIRHKPSPIPHEEASSPLSPLARRYLDTLLAGNREEAGRLVLQALKALQNGDSLRTVYREVFERTLREVGTLWAEGKIDVAGEHHFYGQRRVPRNRSTDGGGFPGAGGMENLFSGEQPLLQDILQAVRNHRPDVLALSTTMAHNIDSAARIIRLIRESSELRTVGILVGGQAFNLDVERWKQAGADGYAANADEAVKAAGWIVNERRAG